MSQVDPRLHHGTCTPCRPELCIQLVPKSGRLLPRPEAEPLPTGTKRKALPVALFAASERQQRQQQNRQQQRSEQRQGANERQQQERQELNEPNMYEQFRVWRTNQKFRALCRETGSQSR